MGVTPVIASAAIYARMSQISWRVPGGRIFIGPRGGMFTDRAYLRIFHKARAEAFTGTEAASPLARRPYDLRSAAVSTWLNAGTPAAQVAAWAGHSPDVLNGAATAAACPCAGPRKPGNQ